MAKFQEMGNMIQFVYASGVALTSFNHYLEAL